ncbi:HAD family hydrolase, partial [Oceanicaulis sp. UBA2681]|uniref:HAD family hydrolase n=1 Tax=Oceanicaulis sp. UBA2681 TaxID=1947007 RepID=UPI0032E47806
MNRTPDLHHVDTWVFDLDETLYPADAAVMSQVIDKMTDWVQREFSMTREEAHALQQHYYTTHGTTLNGLLVNNQVRDLAAFLDFVHDVDHSVITPDPELADHVAALNGRRIVYTNGSRKHAEKVIDQLGLNGLFEDLYDIEAA